MKLTEKELEALRQLTIETYQKRVMHHYQNENYLKAFSDFMYDINVIKDRLVEIEYELSANKPDFTSDDILF